MKFWKLAFLALTGVFTLQTAGCVISSDDDDDDDDNGDSGTGGANGNAGTGGVSGNAGTGGVSGNAGTGGVSGTAGTGGTGGTGGSGGSGGSGGLTGGTVVDDLVDLFSDPADKATCRSCLENLCAAEVTACGNPNNSCSDSMLCVYQDVDAQIAGGADGSIECAFVSCGSTLTVEPNANAFVDCMVTTCLDDCRIDTANPAQACE
jgi:hypothetical protein